MKAHLRPAQHVGTQGQGKRVNIINIVTRYMDANGGITHVVHLH